MAVIRWPFIMLGRLVLAAFISSMTTLPGGYTSWWVGEIVWKWAASPSKQLDGTLPIVGFVLFAMFFGSLMLFAIGLMFSWTVMREGLDAIGGGSTSGSVSAGGSTTVRAEPKGYYDADDGDGGG